MLEIAKNIQVSVSSDQAFHKFLHEFNNWWPREYTWSRDKLIEIRIDARVGGLCTEVGPYEFRCDWGRVTELVTNQKIGLKWQISPKREPVPDPEQASTIEIKFAENQGGTLMELVHQDFERHGAGIEEYRDAMDSEYGWDYILKCYQTYCKQSS
ncbi:SRPBCC domain-containing protein [Tunicatimonas pelagia]|uniref:SRPBCC domain-containing protein n=1 Tax=Tunicatimonas pelagia TaxID=931531 RepID=UPI002665D3B8|nr:SRPBCC domain-containing protein [Tunicatimonas pelagia]WKN41656.1 SRPBCC domain-containing protein [Tunicatimonas pelagia]